jgi:hypothetical protein
MSTVENNSLLRAAERVRAKREAERATHTPEQEVLAPLRSSAKHRARLNHIPDDASLADVIRSALTALSRGVRWARGSILNLLV